MLKGIFMKACFQTVLLFLFSTLIAFQVNAGEYEFGHYEYSATDKCHLSNSVNGCTIQFKKQYSQTPLVFLMPTIPANNPDADRPQTVSLLNVTKDSFTIKQFAAPLDDDIKLNKELMMSISYFVMEPGELTLDDGHKIYAGFINTGKYAGDGEDSKPAYENVNINGFSFSESPIVLSEVQTRNNNRWFTSAVHNITATQLKLGLEITRVERDDVPDDDESFPKTEKIAYLVSDPASGLSGGYQYEFTKVIVPRSSGKTPLKSVCDRSHGFQQRYDSLPFVIGGKLERKGGQGGWLRRCALTDNGVSFVIDEDIPDDVGIGKRSHTSEQIGFMAFAKKTNLPPTIGDYCELFPNAVQSHNKNRSLLYISSNAHIERNLDKRYELGFKSFTDYTYPKGKTCRNENGAVKDHWQCTLNEDLIVEPFKGDLPVNIDGINVSYDANGVHDIANDGHEFGNVVLAPNAKVRFASGIYKIKKLELQNSAKIIINNDDVVVIYVDKIDSQGKINVVKKNGIYQLGKPESLFIFGVNEDGDVTPDFNGNGPSLMFRTFSEVSAYIYSKGNIKFSNNNVNEISLIGAVTARNLRLDSNTKLVGGGACLTPPEDNFILEIEPETAFSLTCDYLPVTFRVKKEDGTLADTYSGSVSVTTNIAEAGKASWFPINSDTPYKDVSEETSVNIVNGIGQLRLKSHDYIGNIAVTGQLDNSPSANIVKGSYTFVPFKFGFEPSPVKVIAGKPTAVKIKALACENDEATVATGYSGNKRLSISSAFLQPSTKGNGDLELKALSSDWQNQQETFSFLNGVAEFSLRYPDAGIVDLKLADPKCSISNGCDILPSDTLPKSFADWTQLEGSVEVHARPWTFAVCPKNKDGEYVKADGTSSSGEGFVAAGDKFDVDVKPIVWRSAGSETADINSLYSNSIDLCESVITPNFFKAGAPAARVELSIPSDHSITPVNGKPGELQGITVKEHTETLTYADLSWSEVGSVRLQADAKAPYLAMTINQGYRHLGRFYPKFLELQPNSFTYPDGHNEFAYLSQPFNADLMIKAKNALGEQVENYNGFVSDFQAEVSLMAYEYPSLNSLNDRFSYHHVTRSTDQSFKGRWNSDIEQVLLLERKSVTKTPLTTVEDGPWNDSNSRWGGYISSYHDPIFIRNTTTDVTDDVDSKQVAHFETTPNLHYGRMVLSDAISMFDKPVTIPLKIEHWNGTEFVTHGDDSGSKYNSNYFCKVALHPTGAENESILTANKIDHVTLGKSDKIEAHPNLSKPDDYKKQQTRFWLRIANDAPVDIGCSQDNKEYQPWLTYNWRELGDEDPSAVVTFGVYRGNDRIVYRGEKGLN
ncbi:DUF6701 domain-containing protein [Photobacterium leiognathi]|uniref:DUF6701 domain-containing protein n=1 Tax=Photobacterium leiognathi TaxID=553611 RepID=UPI002981CF7E|nr:DUF6701 domain-containing protein [Photobacterium leiognathi]